MRGHQHIEGLCISMLGSTQPGRLAEYIGRALRGGAGAPISTVAATDDGRDVTAVSGLELYAGLEVHAAF